MMNRRKVQLEGTDWHSLSNNMATPLQQGSFLWLRLVSAEVCRSEHSKTTTGIATFHLHGRPDRLTWSPPSKTHDNSLHLHQQHNERLPIGTLSSNPRSVHTTNQNLPKNTYPTWTPTTTTPKKNPKTLRSPTIARSARPKMLLPPPRNPLLPPPRSNCNNRSNNNYNNNYKRNYKPPLPEDNKPTSRPNRFKHKRKPWSKPQLKRKPLSPPPRGAAMAWSP